MVIRHEKFTNLIWSNIDKGYFIPNSEKINDEVDKIISRKSGNNENKKILNELKQMGLQDNVRVIDSENESLSAPLEYYFD